MASFDSRSMSFNGANNAYAASNGDLNRMSQPSASFRSNSDLHNRSYNASSQVEAQIYTAVYSNIGVYEMEINGVAVMRRRSDSWLNATQILKVAGVDKGRRTKILEKEILTGEHEKIQGGYGRYQGTWISYQRGREFCRAYGVEDVLRPLLEYDLDNDGPGGQGKNDTPTKEQAMAANRKRYYNNAPEPRSNGQSGTLFGSHSSTVQTALAAMNKFSRYENQMPPRPNSSNRRPANLSRRISQQPHSQEPNSQQSIHSFTSDHALDSALDGGPPRKKMRPSFTTHMSQDSFAREEETPTEPNDSFMMSQGQGDHDAGFSSLLPLETPESRFQEERKAALLDLFVDAPSVDYYSTPAIAKMQGAELDVPLDKMGNTALHWAASLAKIDLIRALLDRGANMFRGNHAGQTPLMSAVCTNNNFDVSTFHEILELLGPLLEIRDAQGRTVVHHIAVSSGVQNRAPSSRYYLEALLEFCVRQGVAPYSQGSSTNNFNTKVKPVNLGRFMSDVVNVQDKSGKTALVLAARIGNHAIIDQLEEVGADFYLADNSGFRPVDFGILPKQQQIQQQTLSSQSSGTSQGKAANHIEQMEREMQATTRAILAQTQEHYNTELAKKQTRVDALNASLKSVAQEHKDAIRRQEYLRKKADQVKALKHKQSTLRAFIEHRTSQVAAGAFSRDAKQRSLPAGPDALAEIDADDVGDMLELDASVTEYLDSLTTAQLNARLAALTKHSSSLYEREMQFRSHSMEKEALYRKAISLVLRISEEDVDAQVRHLIQAVESEPLAGDDTDAVRIREFLRKVETVQA